MQFVSRSNVKFIYPLFLGLLLGACGGSSGGGSGGNGNGGATPPDNSEDFQINIGQTFLGTLPGAVQGNEPFSFTLINSPAGFSLEDATDGSFTFFASTNNGNQTINYTYSDSVNSDVSKSVILKMNDDPLFSHQWHINNTGQKNFAFLGGTAGEDINLDQAIRDGYDGQNIVIAVVDDGLEIAHADLQSNIVTGSRDFVNSDNDPTPAAASDFHGTAVAGIAAATGWNNIGVRGVAPEAGLIGFNYLITLQTDTIFLNSHGSGENVARIYNMSYGSTEVSTHQWSTVSTDYGFFKGQVTDGSRFSGNGRFYIKSAGNGFNLANFGGGTRLTPDFDDSDFVAGLPFQNSNQEPLNAFGYTTVVSALNADGNISSYSTWGSSVFISAPGGEFGRANSNTIPSGKPAVMTTNRSGCSAGYNALLSFQSAAAYPFLTDSENNPNCDYSNLMNGTSAAAPVVSGAIAVILDAAAQNSKSLDWRDVRHILINSAEKINSSDSSVTMSVNGSNFVAHDGWVENSAEYDFNNKFGFGRIDLDAAVNLVKSWDTDLGDFVESSWQSSGDLTSAIPNNSASGVTNTISVSTDLDIEAVQVRVSATHSKTQDLAVVLTSPDGTRSVLMTPQNSLLGDATPDPGNSQVLSDNYNDSLLLTYAFYGENTVGDWTIRLVDTSNAQHSYDFTSDGNTQTFNVNDNSSNGTLTNWRIRFFGHAP